MAPECAASGRNPAWILRRRPPDGPQRAELRPRRLCRCARGRVGSAFLVRGDCLLQAFASFRTSITLVGTLIAGGFGLNSPSRPSRLGDRRVFCCFPLPPLL